MKRQLGILTLMVSIIASGAMRPAFAKGSNSGSGCTDKETKEQKEKREKVAKETKELQEKHERIEREHREQEKERKELREGIRRA